MTLLPIVVRELRVTARSRSFYRARFWTALGSIAFGSYVMLLFSASGSLGGSLSTGRTAFVVLSSLGFFYCIGLSRNTMDCISEEKREGTLGLLFLTDLKGYDVVLGKLCANSVRSFYALLATVPVVCCVWVMGGVSGLELWRMVLALLNVFFFSHAAGLLVSTLSREARRAHAAAAALLRGLFHRNSPAGGTAPNTINSRARRSCSRMFSPAFACQEAEMVGSRFSPYWRSLLLVHLNAWLFLAVASLALPRCWQDKPVKTDTRWRTRLRQWCYGPPAAREALRLRLIGTNPFLWLVSRNRLGQITVWGVLGVIACGWVWIWLASKVHLRDAMPLFVMIILLYHGVLKFWMASEASSHLSEQRRSGALEYLLCCTPLSVPEILRGQWLALRRRFLRPMIAVLVLDVVFTVLSLTSAARNNASDEGYFIIYVLAAMLMLVADAVAIGWVGMWQAMVEKKPRTAAGRNHFPHPDSAVADLRFDVVGPGCDGGVEEHHLPSRGPCPGILVHFWDRD